MPQTKKYLDFVASAPYERGSKHGGPDARRSYVTIACPHCDAAFERSDEERSLYTVNIYMNSVRPSDGGATVGMVPAA